MRERIATLARAAWSPRLFLAGFAVGLLACAAAGWRLAHEGYYRDFTRIAGAYQVDNTFTLSAAQMKKLVASQCARDRVPVLIGGSSILMGTGQPARHLWSRKLGERLGAGFCVFNLAGPAGALNGFASTTLAMIEDEYPRAYLVSDMTETAVRHSPDGVVSQKYYFWDAYYKGLMPPHALAKMPLSRGDVPAGGQPVPAKDAERAEQLRLGARLDSILRFNDLWSYVAYSHFTTYYFHNAGAFQWTARRTWPDRDYEVDFAALRALRQYTEPVGSPAFSSNVERLRRYVDFYFTGLPGPASPIEARMAEYESLIRDNVVDATRQRVIMVYVGVSPYYMDHVGPTVLEAYEALYRRRAQDFARHGFHVLRPGLRPEDFGDLVHLNALGAEKLAGAVAAKIRDLEARP